MNVKTTLVLAIFGIYSTANAQSNGPEKCPTVAALQANVSIRLEHILLEKEPEDGCCDANGFPYHLPGVWGSQNFYGLYETNDRWQFQFSGLSANSAEEALNISNKVFNSLVFDHGPTKYVTWWYCSYRAGIDTLSVHYVGDQ